MDSKLLRLESFPHLNSEYHNPNESSLNIHALVFVWEARVHLVASGMGWCTSREEKVDDCRHGVLVAGAVKLAEGKKTICD